MTDFAQPDTVEHPLLDATFPVSASAPVIAPPNPPLIPAPASILDAAHAAIAGAIAALVQAGQAIDAERERQSRPATLDDVHDLLNRIQAGK
jgi:hypothetical protein